MNNDVELIPVKGVLPSVQVQSDNVIYVPQAHKNKAGIVKEGDGVLIENGVVSLNKQTVEDMIDANKWVSYGFEQNLTEDEKGMARHNIGAGDNYFTGSYYDLTQKPHLNTNNTTGLDYGDEELNDTINLHKISKTGSFNDLKHVPQETLNFAESERQKSKNLFDLNYSGIFNSKIETSLSNFISMKSVYGEKFSISTDLPNYSFTRGSVGDIYTNIIFKNLKPNTSYTISFTPISVDNDVVVHFLGVYNVHDKLNTKVTKTITTDENGRFNTGYGIWINGQNTTFVVKDIQLEEGSVATDYQPYNGAIVHEKQIADVEHIETIYDKNSSDSAINWGYTSGIKGGVTISDKDFSKYKELEVYVCTNIVISKYIIDLTQAIIGLNSDLDYYYISSTQATPSDNSLVTMISLCCVNPEKTSFCHYITGYYGNSDTALTSRDNNGAYIVYKIKGRY